MTELKVINKKGLWKDANIRAFILDDAELPKKVATKHRKSDNGITRAGFHALVKKAAQPIKSDSSSSEPSESRPSGDCSETNTH